MFWISICHVGECVYVWQAAAVLALHGSTWLDVVYHAACDMAHSLCHQLDVILSKAVL